MTHCMICFAETPDRISRTLCCLGVICLSCLEAHIVSKINEAIVAIICPLGNCDSLVSEEEIRQLVPVEVFEKYERFKVEVEQNPGIKICPGCSRIYQHPDLEKVEREKVSRPEVMKVTCSKCRLVWCFACQAPWHHGLTCNEFCKGDKSLKIWAKNRGQPARNACRCPKCHVFIQKSSGCDHMCCSRCNTEFCYRCGGKYHDLKFLGNHYDRFSILGCKYNYKPNQPAQRIAVRGALFSGKVVLAPVVASLAVSAGCVVLGAGLVAAPFYAPYVLIKRQRAKHKQKKLRNRKTMENSSL